MFDTQSAPTPPYPIPITSDHHKALRRAVKDNLTRQTLMMLASCINCGICADACHYYAATGDPELIPINKAEKLASLLRSHFHPWRSRLPFLKSTAAINEKELDTLFKAAFEDCTLCGKCALTCPMGINTGEIMYLARAMLCSIGRLPEGLVQTVESALTVGNYLGLATNDFVENVEWIGEELADELEEENFSIPIDKKGAETLYIPHPLEVRDLPFLLMYAVQIMHAAGEDYTFSSYDFDTVNYAYYQGNPEKMARIVQRVLDAAAKLDARKIVMAPCGHGYLAMRWESEKFFGRRHTLPVLTIVEQIDRFLQAGRISLKKDLYPGPITFHDPCNIGRRGGVIQAPRNILRALTSEYVEMQPYGVRNYCCGGGGGLGSTSSYGKIRLKMGKTKAEQIRRSGAKVVVTGCFNCMTQIRDLNKEYELGIEIKSIVELTAGALA